MNVLIKGHQTEIQQRWKDHVYDRLEKLDRYSERIIKIEVTLTASHHHLQGNEMCHVFIKVPRKTIDVKKTGETMMEAIDAAMKVAVKQVQSLWKDVKTRNRHARVARLAKRGALVQ